MESRIPLPTDNIYKFYALFGLLLFVFAVGAMLYNTRSTNEFLLNAAVEQAALAGLTAPSAGQQARKDALTLLIKVTISDKNTFKWALTVLVAVGFWTSVYGFVVWHRRIQPIQDAFLALQLRKLRVEVDRLERERRLRR